MNMNILIYTILEFRALNARKLIKAEKYSSISRDKSWNQNSKAPPLQKRAVKELEAKKLTILAKATALTRKSLHSQNLGEKLVHSLEVFSF